MDYRMTSVTENTDSGTITTESVTETTVNAMKESRPFFCREVAELRMCHARIH